MKILGWMHRKFRQNTTETHRDFSIGYTGQPSADDLQYYPRGSYGSNSKPFSKAQRENYLRNSFTSLEAARVEEDDYDEEPPNALTELFHGFLAIGTLGTEPVADDPATPTFSISVDHIAEKVTQVTEDELKLINDELEKVLGAESRDDISNVSSGRNSHVSAGRNSHVSAGRNSHVSAGRISHCSTITLSGKPDGCGNEAVVCPLQSYLFGSAIELPDTAPPGRKEHRTSLGELFQKTKQAEENCGKRTEKETEKSAVHSVKRMLKKRIIQAASKGNSGVMDSTTAETKLHKILHMFNRKVHPENATSGHQATKIDIKNNSNMAARNSEGLRPSAEDIIIYPDNMWGCKKQTHLPQLTEIGGDAAGNELWVKSDADYLVLEL